MGTPIGSFQNTEWAFEASVSDPSTATFDSSSLSLEPVSDNVGMNQIIAPTQSIMGTRFEFASRSRVTSELVSGQMVFEASIDVINFFLPYITGTASSPYTLAEACLDFDFMRDEPATTHLFRNCFITQATFSPSSGLVRVALDVTGKVGTIDATFANAAIQVDSLSESYTDAETAVTIAGAQRYCESWQLVIANGLELFQRQSLGYNRVRLGPASVTLNANVEWDSSSEAALYDQGAAGVDANVTFDNGTVSHVFQLNNLVIPNSPVNVDGGEALWNLSGTSRVTIAEPEPLTVTFA